MGGWRHGYNVLMWHRYLLGTQLLMVTRFASIAYWFIQFTYLHTLLCNPTLRIQVSSSLILESLWLPWKATWSVFMWSMASFYSGAHRVSCLDDDWTMSPQYLWIGTYFCQIWVLEHQHLDFMVAMLSCGANERLPMQHHHPWRTIIHNYSSVFFASNTTSITLVSCCSQNHFIIAFMMAQVS